MQLHLVRRHRGLNGTVPRNIFESMLGETRPVLIALEYSESQPRKAGVCLAVLIPGQEQNQLMLGIVNQVFLSTVGQEELESVLAVLAIQFTEIVYMSGPLFADLALLK